MAEQEETGEESAQKRSVGEYVSVPQMQKNIVESIPQESTFDFYECIAAQVVDVTDHQHQEQFRECVKVMPREREQQRTVTVELTVSEIQKEIVEISECTVDQVVSLPYALAKLL